MHLRRSSSGRAVLGKITELRVLNPRDDHPLASADKYKSLFANSDAPWTKEAAEAIERHHKPGTADGWGGVLREADARARDAEFAYDFEQGGLIEPCPVETWFSTKEFIEELKTDLNQPPSETKWIFSDHRTVYCSPDALRAALRRLAARRRCFDLRVIAWMMRRSFLIAATSALILNVPLPLSLS